MNEEEKKYTELKRNIWAEAEAVYITLGHEWKRLTHHSNILNVRDVTREGIATDFMFTDIDRDPSFRYTNPMLDYCIKLRPRIIWKLIINNNKEERKKIVKSFRFVDLSVKKERKAK